MRRPRRQRPRNWHRQMSRQPPLLLRPVQAVAGEGDAGSLWAACVAEPLVREVGEVVVLQQQRYWQDRERQCQGRWVQDEVILLLSLAEERHLPYTELPLVAEVLSRPVVECRRGEEPLL